jgi:hypothetical protein
MSRCRKQSVGNRRSHNDKIRVATWLAGQRITHRPFDHVDVWNILFDETDRHGPVLSTDITKREVAGFLRGADCVVKVMNTAHPVKYHWKEGEPKCRIVNGQA